MRNQSSSINEAFFNSTGIPKNSIAIQEKHFSGGCVGDEKYIILNYVKTKKNSQIVSLTFGGKFLRTKLYYLRYKQGVLYVKEKVLSRFAE